MSLLFTKLRVYASRARPGMPVDYVFWCFNFWLNLLRYRPDRFYLPTCPETVATRVGSQATSMTVDLCGLLFQLISRPSNLLSPPLSSTALIPSAQFSPRVDAISSLNACSNAYTARQI